MIRFVIALLAVIAGSASAFAAEKTPTVYVLLWFDTEDYILPASDDAALKVADWLTKENIPATFKVVGEKARTLEKRKRTDVIEALKKHEIGYHSNFHSVQPTPAMYMSALGWDEGVAEFDRREKPGFDDVKRIFGQTPSCYGQPGSSWGPQSYGALRKWGVPVYLDYGKHVGMNGKPHYYGGALNIYDFKHTLRTKLEGGAELQKAQDQFVEVHKELLAEGGGLVSIYYHPCEFVHKKFWDGANFDKGANPPREKWKLPEVQTEEESKRSYDTFFAYIQFIKRFADVKFITASQAAEMYKDKAAGSWITPAEVATIAESLTKGLSFQNCKSGLLTPSECLELLVKYVADKAIPAKPPVQPKEDAFQFQKTVAFALGTTPFGPSEPSREMEPKVATDASQFIRTAVDVRDYIAKHGRVPSTVWLGSKPVTPEAFLAALAKAAVLIAEDKPLPESIEHTPAKLETEQFVQADNPKLWGWTIFPKGFDAPEMMKLAKRQAWTIKPAVFHGKVEVKK